MKTVTPSEETPGPAAGWPSPARRGRCGQSGFKNRDNIPPSFHPVFPVEAPLALYARTKNGQPSFDWKNNLLIEGRATIGCHAILFEDFSYGELIYFCYAVRSKCLCKRVSKKRRDFKTE